MYFPYFRGKQEELLALQELLSGGALSEEITPIIEPVKLSSTFINTLQTFIEKGRNVYIIQNPLVGDFIDNLNTSMSGKETDKEKRKIMRLIENKKKYSEYCKTPYVLSAFIYLNEDEDIISEAKEESKIALLFNNEDAIEKYSSSPLSDYNIDKMFVPDIDSGEGFTASLVLFRDRYKKAQRNSDYLIKDDEFFTKDNLIYAKNNFLGFSDYSLVGDNFDDSGFSPRAVAVHIVYYDKTTRSFRIKHFVSDTNHTIKNPALKFSEAMSKLVVWCDKAEGIETIGLNKLISYFDSENYPGLGSVKRYSIMHHLEIVGRFLQD